MPPAEACQEPLRAIPRRGSRARPKRLAAGPAAHLFAAIPPHPEPAEPPPFPLPLPEREQFQIHRSQRRQGRIRNLIIKSHHREIAPRSQSLIHHHRIKPYRHTVVPAQHRIQMPQTAEFRRDLRTPIGNFFAIRGRKNSRRPQIYLTQTQTKLSTGIGKRRHAVR